MTVCDRGEVVWCVCHAQVLHTGPTYIAIRSGKHSSSTALSHAADLDRLLQLPDFAPFVKTAGGHIKPVLMITVDGGPDENPRYKKVISVAVHHFVENDLDALIVATNAPGRSAFKRVERRMAPLSRELAGLILPHEHYGSHLDADGKTIDDELELANFAFAGRPLSEVWGGMVIDSHPVISACLQMLLLTCARQKTLFQLSQLLNIWQICGLNSSRLLTLMN